MCLPAPGQSYETSRLPLIEQTLRKFRADLPHRVERPADFLEARQGRITGLECGARLARVLREVEAATGGDDQRVELVEKLEDVPADREIQRQRISGQRE